MDTFTVLALIAGLVTFAAGVGRVYEHARKISREGPDTESSNNRFGGGAPLRR
ncbi:hypothetical protein HDF12_000090 [Edaphobacter lichenicola]|uniref:Uncharacterized protein n=2 Tax=Tunturiibacter TaxID=3154218 RepID=A0A7Y9T7M2_9BACT|nr:hypothetical protein [Edaphobacter lichenicola]NYF49725.1 hypothetical protein [Edaphobacter lichenicola]